MKLRECIIKAKEEGFEFISDNAIELMDINDYLNESQGESDPNYEFELQEDTICRIENGYVKEVWSRLHKSKGEC